VLQLLVAALLMAPQTRQTKPCNQHQPWQPIKPQLRE